MKRISIIIIALLLCATVGAKVLDVAAPFGSRKNPVQLGQAILLTYNGDKQITLAVQDIRRGADAAQIIRKANMFNPSPRAGNEFLLVNMYAEYNKDLKGNDAPFSINEFSFDISDGTYTVTETGITAMFVPDELAATMYEGGKTSGWICYQIKQGDNPYIIYDDDVWFDLTPAQM